MSARACICRWSPCFSRPTGSILGLYTAQPLPHLTALAPPSCLGMYLSGVSKLLSCLVMYLLPHVSGLLRPPCFTPAFQAAWSCIFNIRGFETATWHVLARLEKPKKNKKTSNSVKLARLCQHEPASVDGRPASAAQLGLFWVYIRHSPCLTSLLWPLQAAWACIFQAFRSC